MFKDLLTRVQEIVLPGNHRQSAEIDSLKADVRELERSLRDLRKELREIRGGAVTPQPLNQTTSPASDLGRSVPAPTSAGDHVVIREEDCIGCGTCVEIADQVFSMNPGAKAQVIRQGAPRDTVQKAIDACPVTCIYWTQAT